MNSFLPFFYPVLESPHFSLSPRLFIQGIIVAWRILWVHQTKPPVWVNINPFHQTPQPNRKGGSERGARGSDSSVILCGTCVQTIRTCSLMRSALQPGTEHSVWELANWLRSVSSSVHKDSQASRVLLTLYYNIHSLWKRTGREIHHACCRLLTTSDKFVVQCSAPTLDSVRLTSNILFVALNVR